MTAFAYGTQEPADDSSDSPMLGVSTPSTPPVQIIEEEIVHGPSPPEGEGSDDDLPQEPSKMDTRAYQLEMFEMSLRENIIVAMDTGSGKTQIALLRMRAELDTCSADKVSDMPPFQSPINNVP